MPLALLIDDNLTPLRIREAVLRRGTFCLLRQHGGTRADISPLQGHRAGRIVTDLVLPGASGSAFVRQLREICRCVPVIVISGMAEAKGEYEGLQIHFLRKPCPPECLIREVPTPQSPLNRSS